MKLFIIPFVHLIWKSCSKWLNFISINLLLLLLFFLKIRTDNLKVMLKCQGHAQTSVEQVGLEPSHIWASGPPTHNYHSHFPEIYPQPIIELSPLGKKFYQWPVYNRQFFIGINFLLLSLYFIVLKHQLENYIVGAYYNKRLFNLNGVGELS